MTASMPRSRHSCLIPNVSSRSVRIRRAARRNFSQPRGNRRPRVGAMAWLKSRKATRKPIGSHEPSGWRISANELKSLSRSGFNRLAMNAMSSRVMGTKPQFPCHAALYTSWTFGRSASRLPLVIGRTRRSVILRRVRRARRCKRSSGPAEGSKEASPLAVKVIVVAVQDGGDPADVRSVTARDEELHLSVPEEGVLRGQDLHKIGPDRGDPMRVVLVDLLRNVEEPVQLPLRPPDPLDPDVVHDPILAGMTSTPVRRRRRAPGQPHARYVRSRRGRGRAGHGCAWP